MPTYTVQQESPRVPVRASAAPSSVYSEDFDSAMPDQDVPPVPPLKGQQGSYHPSEHAHAQQKINDYGPQVRQSRLPIFKQVRSMLQKPPALTTPGNPKWDEYTGELSDSGKSSQVQPSKYTSPYKGAFQARRRSPERPNKLKKNASPTRSTKSNKSRRNASPVSILRDNELTRPNETLTTRPNNDDTEWSPISPVSPISPILDEVPEQDQDMIPGPLLPNVVRAPQPPPQPSLPQTPPSHKKIKRKPAPRSTYTPENHPPPPPSPQHSPTFSIDMKVRVIDDKDADPEEPSPQPEPSSHFSWTTYAPSLAPSRQSTDTNASKFPKRHSSLLRAAHEEQPNSRFSWSTVATNTTTPHLRPESPPPSPPPPIPAKYSTPTPQMQSIVSRRRPIPRLEKEEWAPPPPRKNSAGSATPQNTTPISSHTARPLPVPPRHGSGSSTPTSTHTAAGKALPPPPSASPNLTHLQQLEVQQQNLIHQRRNVQKGITELEKIERASPMDVPFATVRDTKRKLDEHRRRLEEILLEERDVGVRITRARRKEEREEGWDGEGIWVRRVTG